MRSLSVKSPCGSAVWSASGGCRDVTREYQYGGTQKKKRARSQCGVLAAHRRDPGMECAGWMYQPRYQYFLHPNRELTIKYPPFGTFRIQDIALSPKQCTYRRTDQVLYTKTWVWYPLLEFRFIGRRRAMIIRIVMYRTNPCQRRRLPPPSSSQLHQFCLPITILSRYPHADQSQKKSHTVILFSFLFLPRKNARPCYAFKNAIQDFAAPIMLHMSYPILSSN